MSVSLYDADMQVHETVTVTTNEFGSASGSFTLPATGMLGNWNIRTDHGSWRNVRVEEYRRPTFEVSLLDPQAPLRLGRLATVIGRADYYFGAAVSEGRAVWRVRRQVDLWRGWSSVLPYGGGEIVASDTTIVSPEGDFEIVFSTQASPAFPEDQPQLLTYHVEVEVTDAGGETRTAARSYSVATVSVLASIEGGRGFYMAGSVDTVRILRTDANRVGQAGRGRWVLHALKQPERTLMPGDVPLFRGTGLAAHFATPGDSLRPRWETSRIAPNPGADWPLGDELASGWLEHDDQGEAILSLDFPSPGIYRLVYETEAAGGRTSRATRELLVAGSDALDIRAPLVLATESDELAVGEVARFFVHSGLTDSAILLHVFVGGELLRREFLPAGSSVIEVPVTTASRWGIAIEASLVHDHQLVQSSAYVRVSWRDKQLAVAFDTFRDRLQPGETERVTVTITGPDAAPVAGELLAWMVDRSLDAIARFRSVDPLALITARPWPHRSRDFSLGSHHPLWRQRQPLERPELPVLRADQLRMFPGTRLEYTIDYRGQLRLTDIDPELAARLAAEGIELLPAINVEAARYMVEVRNAVEKFERYAIDMASTFVEFDQALSAEAGIIVSAELPYVRGVRSGEIETSIDETLDAIAAREDFAETAFFLPHVLLDNEGRATFEFRVPEAVTEWRLQVAAHTRDLMAGRAERYVRTVKELLVRPYLPRFLREGDEAELRVVITSMGEEALAGTVQLRLEDPFTGEDRSADFDLRETRRTFAVNAGGTTAVSFPVRTPAGVGEVAVRAVATAGNLSDGERRALPILPGRTHHIQSRFAALANSARRELTFPDILATDPTRRDEQLVVTVDTQLLTSVLRALPHLVEYPYRSTEQTLNSYLGVSILAGVYGDHPWVAARAAQLAGRETPREPWEAPDPNRRLRFEETPWLQPSRGAPTDLPLVDLLNPEIVKRQRLDQLGRLREHQDKSGGFPWIAGGEPSLWMTLYVLMGLARGSEFGPEIPKDIVRDAWRWVRANTTPPGADGTVKLDPNTLTMLNYTLSCYDDETVDLAGFTAEQRDAMLAFSWHHRLALSRLLQARLALTLERAGRHDDACAIVAALLDVAQKDPDLGVFWAPEDRAWLWTNDTIEGHAFILRAVSEIVPEEPRLAGLAQWLLLNRQLAHWKSTRATAEAIYALVHYQHAAGTLA
ncbi:MAG: alpha-2-macroglobulin family protein, partial [Candidatus Krumholzibacteria bacterium]|nr:alpha-2-macroglobulin family protein [Candidatus Krumholzibacteria bacterium]